MEQLAGGRLLVRAPAKLNLSLRVGPIRPDGYHRLDSLVAKVTLYDELILSIRADGRVHLTCDQPAAGAPDDNLAFRAAKLLSPHAGGLGADITLGKHIAVGAGLGGGSSDAAAALTGLNRLWNCRLDAQRLSAMAAQLGSDVPLFLGPPAARMTGRGEHIEPVELPAFAAVLLTPPLHCPTGEVYRAYDAIGPGPLEPLEIAALIARPASKWPPLMTNDLLPAAERVRGELADWRRRLAATGEPVHLTGSGSALFVLADDVASAATIRSRLDDRTASLARIVSLNPW